MGSLIVRGAFPWLTVLCWGSRSMASLTGGDLMPSLLIPLGKQWSFLHAWLSSLRKTDGLKFFSSFRIISFWHWGVVSPSAAHLHCRCNVKNQRVDTSMFSHLLNQWHRIQLHIYFLNIFYCIFLYGLFKKGLSLIRGKKVQLTQSTPLLDSV